MNQLSSDYTQKIKMAAPVNLLDNSDFRNPVNQRNITHDDYFLTNFGYTIDRWRIYGGSDGNVSGIKIVDNGIQISLYSGDSYFDQLIKINATIAYTFAAKIDNAIEIISGIPINGIENDTMGLGVNSEGYVRCFFKDYSKVHVIEWAALYEGEYTVDTLPEYRPKGYGNEFMECQRYYRRYTNVGIGGNNIFLTGVVSSSATGIYCSSLNNLPMRIPSPTINFTGIVIIRTIDGYETTSGSAGYTDPIVDLYYDGSDAYLAPLRFRKQDGSAWGITNNTPVHIMIKSGILEITADL